MAGSDKPLTQTGKSILVRACKFDGSVHRTWNAELIRRDGSLLVLDGKFGADVQHDLLGFIASGTHSLEYYWLDRWYSIFRFGQPDGSVRNFYCNVNVPPAFDGEILSYTDLDLDILVNPDFSYRILDVEEFERNGRDFGYPADVQTSARQALAELAGLIETRAFPFSE
jgi:uncharacterized protein